MGDKTKLHDLSDKEPDEILDTLTKFFLREGYRGNNLAYRFGLALLQLEFLHEENYQHLLTKEVLKTLGPKDAEAALRLAGDIEIHRETNKYVASITPLRKKFYKGLGVTLLLAAATFGGSKSINSQAHRESGAALIRSGELRARYAKENSPTTTPTDRHDQHWAPPTFTPEQRQHLHKAREDIKANEDREDCSDWVSLISAETSGVILIIIGLMVIVDKRRKAAKLQGVLDPAEKDNAELETELRKWLDDAAPILTKALKDLKARQPERAV